MIFDNLPRFMTVMGHVGSSFFHVAHKCVTSLWYRCHKSRFHIVSYTLHTGYFILLLDWVCSLFYILLEYTS